MEAVSYEEAPFLLSRNDAAKRYGLSEREMDRIIKGEPEFPSIKRGRRVLIHRDMADAWFTRNVREAIEME